MMLSPSLHTETAMAKAETYAEWSEAVREQDRRNGKVAWRETDQSEHYDYRSIRRRLERLLALRALETIGGPGTSRRLGRATIW